MVIIKGEGRGNKFNNSIPHVHHRDVKNISSSENKDLKASDSGTHTTNRLTGVNTINCLEFNPIVTLSGRFPSGRLQTSLGITTFIVRCLGTRPKHLHSPAPPSLTVASLSPFLQADKTKPTFWLTCTTCWSQKAVYEKADFCCIGEYFSCYSEFIDKINSDLKFGLHKKAYLFFITLP